MGLNILLWFREIGNDNPNFVNHPQDYMQDNAYPAYLHPIEI